MNGKTTYFATLVNEKSFNAKISYINSDFMKFYLDQNKMIQYKSTDFTKTAVVVYDQNTHQNTEQGTY